MSALGAIVAYQRDFDVSSLLNRMVQAGAPLDIHGSNTWAGDGVGLAHCHFWTTAEEVGESQPLVDMDAKLAVCLDGRIDNRDDVLNKLADAGCTSLTHASDAKIVLSGFRRWGPDLFEKLVGDFAIVLWDERQRRLVAARDALGRRSLFYHASANRFVCGTLLRQVFCDQATPRAVSDWAVANHLSAVHSAPDATFYENIKRLPAGHWMEAGLDGTLRIQRYWDPTRVRLKQISLDEFVDEFREQFLLSVSARLRTNKSTIALQVSGGLDSTAVVGAVHHLNEAANLGLDTLALQNVAEHPKADERVFQTCVLERFPKMCVTTTKAEEFWAMRQTGIPRHYREEPLEADYAARMVADLNAARESGAQVLLTGDGGDEVGGSSWYLVDRILRGQWPHLWSELSLRARGRGISRSALTKTLVSLLVQWLRRSTVQVPRQPPPWIDRDFARRLNLFGRLRHPTTYKNPAREDVYQRLRYFCVDPHYSAGPLIHQTFGVETRQPFLDRRLFEWALSIPPSYFGDRGLVKVPMRRALADLMPPSILARADKGNYLYYWDLGLRYKERNRILRLLDRPVSDELGYVDGRILRDCYLKYCQGGKIHRRQLWNALMLERWLRED